MEAERRNTALEVEWVEVEVSPPDEPRPFWKLREMLSAEPQNWKASKERHAGKNELRKLELQTLPSSKVQMDAWPRRNGASMRFGGASLQYPFRSPHGNLLWQATTRCVVDRRRTRPAPILQSMADAIGRRQAVAMMQRELWKQCWRGLFCDGEGQVSLFCIDCVDQSFIDSPPNVSNSTAP